MNKKQYGQFYTTNFEYIFKNFKIPENENNIIEPFTGNGDLLKFIPGHKKIECYDIEPKTETTIQRDTLNDPPEYADKYIITNPPYLARNKSKDKTIFDKYNQNDLYKCFLESFCDKPNGGILIVPLNFWCSIRVSDINLRKSFLSKYDILFINIFEERVFEDTSYTVCSFQFSKIIEGTESITKATIFPSGKCIEFRLNDGNNYTIGGEIYNLKRDPDIKISRLTTKNDTEFKTSILLKCIDDTEKSKICLSYSEKDYIDNTPKLSARSYATLVIEPKISIKEQKALINKFNNYLDKQRELYNSLFLTNYRESKSVSRKRISFKLAYCIINYCLKEINN